MGRTKSGVAHLISRVNETEDVVTVCGFTLACIEVNEIQRFGQNLIEFFKLCKDENIKTIYLHDFNLEGDFIIQFLYDIGLELVSTYPKDMQFNVFKVQNKLYKIVAYFNNSVFTFYGSRNIIHASVKDIASAWCGVNVNIDDGIFQLKHNEGISMQMQNDCMRYCRIIAIALKQWRKNGYREATVGSEALEQWKKSYPNWQEDFMNKIDIDIEEKFRKAYRGGFTWLKPSMKNKIINKGIVIDANAMYSTMMTMYDMPYGEPIRYTDIEEDEEEQYNLCIMQIRISAILKENCIPCISTMEVLKYANVSSFSKSEYQDNIDNLILWITNYDLELIKNNYDVLEAEVLDAYYFKSKQGIFDNYLNFWYDKKVRLGKGAERETCKLMYESLSGKFGSRTDGSIQIPIINNGYIEWIERSKEEKKENNSFRYVPLIIFTTSLARLTIINLAKRYYDRLIYVDTDSLHLIGDEVPNDIIIGNKLGQFKVEARFNRAKYIGLKNYIHDEIMDDGSIETVTKMAGAPSYVQNQLGWNNFCTGTEVKGKPMTKKLIGGTIRYYTTYKLLMN